MCKKRINTLNPTKIVMIGSFKVTNLVNFTSLRHKIEPMIKGSIVACFFGLSRSLKSKGDQGKAQSTEVGSMLALVF